MNYEKDPFEYEEIPDFAMRPAKAADEDIDNKVKAEEDQFDPTAYDRILGGFNPQEQERKSEESAAAAQGEANAADLAAEAAAKPVEVGSQGALEKSNEMFELPRLEKGRSESDAEEIAEATQAAEIIGAVTEGYAPMSETQEINETVRPAFGEDHSDAIAAPEAKPTTGEQPAKAPPVKIIPLAGSLLSSKLKLVDIKEKPKARVYIEEDVLVPDVKPDLSEILAIGGKIKLSDKEISAGQNGADYVKVTGDLAVEILYLPDAGANEDGIVSIESRLSFKSECSAGAAPNSQIIIHPEIESVDYTIINERKVRVKAAVMLSLKEYGNLDVDLFEGVKGEEVQMLKEKIRVTDVALRKNQTTELKEDLALKDSMPEVDKILKYNINVVESHKQITKGKAVINAAVYCNVMYSTVPESGEAAKAEGSEAAVKAGPSLFQGKTEFTQFIKLPDDFDTESKNLIGSKVDFHVGSANIGKKESEDGRAAGFELSADIDTALELYQNIEKEIVTDVYHNVKDIQYDTEDLGLMSLAGSGASEISVREIINVPEKNGGVDRVAYIAGELKEVSSSVEDGRSIAEGIAVISLICIGSDEKKNLFSMKQEIPFRSSIDIPGAKVGMSSSNQLMLKDLWFDKINNRQIEVNAGIAVTTSVSKEEKHKLIKNVSFVEMPEGDRSLPSVILYITKAGDNIWKIAKKYRTTIEEIKKINEMEYAAEIKPGTKLLIVTKSH